LSLNIVAQSSLELTVHKLWQYLDDAGIDPEMYGGKLVLGGTLEITKRTQAPIFISQIRLMWKGSPLSSLVASLYKQELDKEFLPIEDFWLSDGIWNKHHQYLTLTLDKPLLLEAKTMLHVVFTLPQSIESCLQQGTFQIETYSSGKSLYDLIPHGSYTLAYNGQTKKKSNSSKR
jgi:hypothetical protein